MMRLTIHVMATLALLLCGALGAMRAQPYDDGGLGAGLAAPDCAPPCFLGIRPGTTTASDALHRLEGLDWVESVQADAESIIWTWNGQQPAFLHTDHNYARILLRDGVVHWIGIDSAARMADMKIVFGTPDATYTLSQQVRDSTKNYYATFSEYALYPAQGLEAVAYTLCPPGVASMWELPVMLVLPAAEPFFPETRGAFVPLPGNCR